MYKQGFEFLVIFILHNRAFLCLLSATDEFICLSQFILSFVSVGGKKKYSINFVNIALVLQ